MKRERMCAAVLFEAESDLRVIGGRSALVLLHDMCSTEQQRVLRLAKIEKKKLYDIVKPPPSTKPKGPSKDDHLKALAEFALSSKDAPVKLREVAALYAKVPVQPPSQSARRVARA